jgi:hypothetical protein
MEEVQKTSSDSRIPHVGLPISKLQVIVEVAERYKPLFSQLLIIFQEMYDNKNKSLLFDLQPLAPFVKQEKSEGFKNLMNEIRNHFNIHIKSPQECKKRLVSLKSRFTKNEEIDIIDNALELLNLPTSSEIQSDADFRILMLQQNAKDVDTATDIQEIFIYLNNMFQPVDETTSNSTVSKNKNKHK